MCHGKWEEISGFICGDEVGVTLEKGNECVEKS